MRILTNKLGYVQTDRPVTITIEPVDYINVRDILHQGSFVNMIDDPVLVSVVGNVLGTPLPERIVNINPTVTEDTIILVDVVGPALPKGTTALPPQNTLRFELIKKSAVPGSAKQVKSFLSGMLK